MAQANIETGVDKLVGIINRKGKVLLSEAAKELGVSQAVVQEWADFLEDEGLITIEDNLSKTYLCERKLNKGEVEKKAKEYSSKKDAFVRKVESALTTLQNETANLDQIKAEFEKLKDAIGGDIDQVREELQELKHYEELKKSIDKDILQQRITFQAMIDEIRKKMAEERKKYESVIGSIAAEKSRIEEAKVEIGYLEKKEDTLMNRIAALKEAVKTIENEIQAQQKVIKESSDKLAAKVKESEKLQKDMRYRLELEMEPLMRKTKESEEKVTSVQSSMLQKIMAKSKEINKYKLESSQASEKFKAFFEKKLKTQELIQMLEKDKAELEQSLKELIVKARAFDLSKKSSDVKKYVHELHEDLEFIDKKKKSFSQKLASLTEFITRKE